MSIRKISTGGWGQGGGGGQMSAPKISSGGANVQVAFSTGGQMSIYRFINWGANVLGANVLGGHMSWNPFIQFDCLGWNQCPKIIQTSQ